MARKKQEIQEERKPLTRAQKTEATKGIIKELLAIQPMKHNELIEEVAKRYVARHEAEGAENPNDVKGRVGSVLDIMKKESEVTYADGAYALKARLPLPPPEVKEEEKPKKRTRAKKAEAPVEAPAEEKAEPAEEKTEAPKKRTRTKKAEAPVEAPAEEKAEAPKKRGRKPKAKAEEPAPVEEKAEPAQAEAKQEAPAPIKEKPVEEKPLPVEEKPVESKVEEPKEEMQELVVKPKAEVAQKGVVMDMSFLFGDKPLKAAKAPQPQKREEPKKEKSDEKQAPRVEVKPVLPAQKTEAKPAPAVKAPVPKAEEKTTARTASRGRGRGSNARVEKPLTADEKLRDAFLKRMRTLGGDYFEYYSVYLLEKYSMRNGRRLEGLRISGGDHDGGIDGEIELTDKLGFKETIYIQSKNWDPEKGKEENWVVGETLLQQFIGACACRQAKDGKQHTRGIFVTTSRFTPDAKRILDDLSDKIVGYDGADLYEAAKECEFGVIKKNGEWVLDEKLLSGTKAFFEMA